MGESYDDSGFTAPQLGMPTRHERIMAQSGHDGALKYLLQQFKKNPLALPGFIIAIVGGVLYIY